MYKASTIANYILWYSKTIKIYINNLKLQCLLYFVQAAFLQERLEPCLDESIFAWETGPKVRSVDEKYKRFGTESIYSFITRYDIENSEEKITEEDKMLIKKVVSSFRNYSSTLLADTIKDQDPFKKAYNPESIGKITIASMMDFFLTEE